MDLLVASLARERLWLTDAYFMANVPYVQALRRAAGDGVDVRLLLPSTSDIGWIAAASRTLYGSLIDAGVCVFEWRGPMLHAKTAVADGLWSRIGSTNLNAGSWVNNWEMDVSIEDAGVAREMEARYQADLDNADEIVRSGGQRRVAAHPREAPRAARKEANGMRMAAGPPARAAAARSSARWVTWAARWAPRSPESALWRASSSAPCWCSERSWSCWPPPASGSLRWCPGRSASCSPRSACN